jgi:hypothetical protein
MLKYWIILAVLILGGLYCLYAAAFFAWVTATPLSPESLHCAQSLCYRWFWGFIGTVGLFISTAVRMVYVYRTTGKKNDSLAPA